MDEQLHTLALTILFRYSPRKLKQTLEVYPCAQEAWERLEYEGKAQAMDKAQREWEFIQTHQIEVFDARSDHYPYRLKQCPDAPLLLFGKGKLEVNQGKFVAIVGTRQSTPRGEETTRRLILDLAAYCPDTTIVSGLAYGIDVAAHKAAIEAGLATIIVPAHGLDRIYPTMHRPIAVASLNHGGLLTEYPSETEPEKMNFVARNRIVAGLSDAVVVVESKTKGGSLITAQLGNDYNREVFAFPGRSEDVYAQGCNALIRDHKAALISNAEDLMNAMKWTAQNMIHSKQTAMTFTSFTQEQQPIIDILSAETEGVSAHAIMMETGIGYSDVIRILMELEMDNHVRSLPGGIYMLRR